MTLLDPRVLADAFRFPLNNTRTVALGALAYAAVFAAQSLATAYAAAGAGWGAPTALGLIVIGFIVFVAALAGWGRASLGRRTAAPGYKDEQRLLWTAFLVLVLVGIVVLTAGFLAFCVVLGATMVAIARQGYDTPPATAIDTFALLNATEWVAVWLTTLVFVCFSIWFFSRLALAFPATVDQRRVKILSAWPLSGNRRAAEISVTLVLTAIPGIAALAGVNVASEALLGASPAAAQSAAGQGGLAVGAVGFLLAAFVYGAAKMALVGAPCAAALCRLYVKYRTQSEKDALDPET